LKAGLEKILDLAARSRTCGTGGTTSLAFNPGWHTAFDLRSMLVNAEALLRSALERKESRGAHARSDYPDSDEQLTSTNYVVERAPDGMQVRAEQRPPMPEHLAEAVRHSYALYTPEEME
jgi:succinate dehydrogenase / fumarate reductase flavoprotein subunit